MCNFSVNFCCSSCFKMFLSIISQVLVLLLHICKIRCVIKAYELLFFLKCPINLKFQKQNLNIFKIQPLCLDNNGNLGRAFLQRVERRRWLFMVQTLIFLMAQYQPILNRCSNLYSSWKTPRSSLPTKF